MGSLLVVEKNVRLPDGIIRQSHYFQSAVHSWIPSQLVVDPSLANHSYNCTLWFVANPQSNGFHSNKLERDQQLLQRLLLSTLTSSAKALFEMARNFVFVCRFIFPTSSPLQRIMVNINVFINLTFSTCCVVKEPGYKGCVWVMWSIVYMLIGSSDAAEVVWNTRAKYCHRNQCLNVYECLPADVTSICHYVVSLTHCVKSDFSVNFDDF